MLKFEQIKEILKKSIPNYVIRINYPCGFRGLTFNETKCTLISELDLFNNFLDDFELKGGEFDEKYNKRLILSNLLQNERFCHKIIDNDDKPLSPRQFYKIKNEENKNEEKLIEITETIKNESGEEMKISGEDIAFNVFLTRDNEKNMNILRYLKADFTKIFQNPQLFAVNDLTSLNKLIEDSALNFNLKNFELKKFLKVNMN